MEIRISSEEIKTQFFTVLANFNWANQVCSPGILVQVEYKIGVFYKDVFGQSGSGLRMTSELSGAIHW